ncbi:hypothetical protein B296_00049966 [Ensete ventricosum]|uniref:Uncharacterized protein n=1 Tax=Ensete ventricosum TaxID=4639 RepID=A0A426XFR2_ENSVE|nr:hypothetical protein B296_00049966 [Ensete ventricosum]
MEAVLQNSALLPLLLPTRSRPSLYAVSIPQTLSLSFSSSLFPPRFPIRISSRSHSLPGFFSHPSRNSRPFHVSASAVAVQKTGKDRSPVDVLVTETKEPNSSVSSFLLLLRCVCRDRLRAVAEFRLGRSPSPRRSQCGESSDRKENPPEEEEQVTNSSYSRIRVDFPRWEDGDPTGWISCVERYFRYHRTLEASMVDIAAIHLGREDIQWYDWYKYFHGVPI